jgi:hypothetical protein
VINHIDVSSVLRRTVCDLYSNLVTRPTGVAVRTAIEHQLAATTGRVVTVIDFSQVALLDYSCADEIVAKLLLRYGTDDGHIPPDEGYFLFRGINEAHLDAIEEVLARHGLALVAQGDDGAWRVIGAVEDVERDAWEAVQQQGTTTARQLAESLGIAGVDAERLLVRLWQRRVVMRLEDCFIAIGDPSSGRMGSSTPASRAD